MVRARTVIVALLAGLAAALWWGRPAARASAPRPRVAAERTRAALAAARVAPPVAAVQAPALASTGPVFRATWGGGPDQLGRDRPAEGSPVGPMSFAVDPKGRLLVLDNVNDRLVRRNADGSADTLIPVTDGYPEDVAWADDGSMAVLDRFRDRSVSLFDAAGRPVGKLPLDGPGLPDPGSITSIAVDGSDVYAERAHGPMVKLGSLSGVPAADRSEIPGRPSRDGTAYLAAGIVEAAAGRAYVTVTNRTPLQHRYTRELRLDAQIRHVLLLDSDRAGTVYFGAEVQPGESETETEIRIVCLEPDRGAPTGTVSVAANTLPEESFRDLVALPDGGVLVAHRSEQGVTYTRVECE